MPDINEILANAEDEARALARETLVRVGDWIDAEVRANEGLDTVALPDPDAGVNFSVVGNDLDAALAQIESVKESLQKKLEAKEAAGAIVDNILAGVVRIALAAALTAV